MMNEGISDGDTVIVREQPVVENGESAVAYLPDRNEATLKKIYKEKNGNKKIAMAIVVGHGQYIGTKSSAYGNMILKQYFKKKTDTSSQI